MDAYEAVLVIEGYRKRQEVMDDFLAHYTSILLSPHGKRGRAPKPQKLRLISRLEEELSEKSGELSVAERLAERRDFITEHLARTGTPGREHPARR